jgi:predicted NBD/HSP70 family sugar kinase
MENDPQSPKRAPWDFPEAALLEGLYQAYLESVLAGTEALGVAVRSFVDADREKRGSERGFHNLPDHLARAARDAIEVLTDVPVRVRNAYEQGREYVKDNSEIKKDNGK